MDTNQQNQAEKTQVQKSYDPVYDSMIVWNTYRNDENVVSNWLQQGSMFEFTIDMNNSPYLHAYPGYYNGQLVFQLITSDNDVQSNFSTTTPPPNVVTSIVGNKPLPGVGGTIDPGEAIKRVDNWHDEEIWEEWLDRETTNQMMFQAFVIPGDDIVSGDKHAAYFALRKGAEDDYIADLIIINLDADKLLSGKGTVFYDMTRPVPPYKPLDATAKTNFGLLNFVETLM